MEKLKTFFWLCSGVHISLLKKCEVEATKYVGMGATIFFTGVFAAMAASYALYTVFDNVWIATAFGVVWGLMIFNLDRYIVSSMRKEGNAARELKTAIPRIILAVLISLVIAKPLEMKIFEKEIQSELVIIEQQTYTSQENEIRLRFQTDQDRSRNEIAAMKDEISNKTTSRDELTKIAQLEADGTGGSKQRNTGPIYKLKKADADKADQELEQLNGKNNILIQDKLIQITKSDSIIAIEISALAKQKLDGPASRMEALDRLAQKSNAIWWANWFVILLFIAVETAPVFVKLISSQGPYDHLLKTEEYSFEAQRIEALARINADIKLSSKDLPTAEAQFVTDRLDMRLNQS